MREERVKLLLTAGCVPVNLRATKIQQILHKFNASCKLEAATLIYNKLT